MRKKTKLNPNSKILHPKESVDISFIHRDRRYQIISRLCSMLLYYTLYERCRLFRWVEKKSDLSREMTIWRHIIISLDLSVMCLFELVSDHSNCCVRTECWHFRSISNQRSSRHTWYTWYCR